MEKATAPPLPLSDIASKHASDIASDVVAVRQRLSLQSAIESPLPPSPPPSLSNCATQPASTQRSAGPGYDVEQLIHDHQAGIWRYLRALGCEASQADDLTQETFLSVLEKPFEYQGEAATGGYLRRVAHNLYVTAQRRGSKIRYVEDWATFEAAWTCWVGDGRGESLLSALKACLLALTPRARLALEMRFRERQSREAIADALNITGHGAKNLMQRAKQQLRLCVDEKMAAEDA